MAAMLIPVISRISVNVGGKDIHLAWTSDCESPFYSKLRSLDTEDYDNKCQLICIGLTLKVVSRNKDNQNFLKCRIWCKNRAAMTR